MKKLFVLGLLAILLSNCKNNDDDTPKCNDQISCTENIVTLFVEVHDSAGTPVVLDNYQIIDVAISKDLKDDLTRVYVVPSGDRLYPIYTDGFPATIPFENRALTFKGFIAEEEVISAEYVVTADCCHISLVSGNLEIVLN